MSGVAGVTVRTATAEDVPAIRALAALWDADEPSPPPPRGELLAGDVVGAKAWCESLVAEADGEVVGFLLWVRNYDLWSRSRGATLQELFVRRDARRRGVGRALVAELASRVAAGGGRWVSWVMLADNAAGHAFYDALGAARKPEIAFRALDVPAPSLGG